MELQFKEIFKSFGEKKVLKGISFTAQSGMAFGILGRNGAGKTTSIRILMDVFASDKGEVLVDGKKIDYSKLKIGYLPEERGLYPKKKISEQLCYFSELKGMSRADSVKAVDYWLGRLGMSEYRDKKLEILSKGNQQKIQLVTALAHDPKIIVLDEPFSGLDPVNAMLLKDIVKEEIAKGKIVLFSSHQMNYIEEFCSKIAILNDGNIVLQGDIKEIKRNYSRDKLVVYTEDKTQLMSDMKDVCTEYEGGLIIKLSDPSEKKDMMKKLVEKYDIDEIRVLEPTLNDIFVEYTGTEEVAK